MEIVRFGAKHIRAAAQIETLCFSEPWSEGGLELLTKPGGISFAVTVDGELAAYAGMVYVLDEGQIVNVATHPSFRRRGFARSALRALTEWGEAHGIVSLSLEVRESNAAAISLYESEGFCAVGRRPRFYKNPAEAAVVMVKDLGRGLGN